MTILFLLLSYIALAAGDIDLCNPAPPTANVEKLRFLNRDQVCMCTLYNIFYVERPQALSIAQQYDTPVYVYSMKALQAQAQAALAFPNAFGQSCRLSVTILYIRSHQALQCGTP